jgi:hypothetical protein
MTAAAVFSCSREVTVSRNVRDVPVQFTAGSLSIRPQTRTAAGGDEWVTGDSIGIYMVEAGTANLSNGVDNYRYNVSSISGGTATFAANSGNEMAFYPASGNVDFIACYPYRSGQALDAVYPVDVTDQSDPAAIDLLYSSNATGQNQSSGTVALSFTHALAKLKLKIRAGANLADLSGLSAVEIQGVGVSAGFDLTDGTATPPSSGNILPLITSTAADSLREAILIPGQYASGKVKFTVSGSDYFWSLSGIDFLPANLYSYEITINGDDVSSTGNIVPWNDNGQEAGNANQ